MRVSKRTNVIDGRASSSQTLRIPSARNCAPQDGAVCLREAFRATG